MPNESTQTMVIRYKRCVYCGGDVEPVECGQPEETYTSNWGKERKKPKDKMRRKHEDK